MIRNTSPAKSPKRLGSQWAAIPESVRLNSGLYRQPSGAKKPLQTDSSSLFRHCPRSDTSVRLLERSETAAAGKRPELVNRVVLLAAGAVGTDRADDAARGAGPAAIVKRGVLGPLRWFRAEPATMICPKSRTPRIPFRRNSIRSGICWRRIWSARPPRPPGASCDSRNSPFVAVGTVDDRSPGFQVVHFAQPRQHSFGCFACRRHVAFFLKLG